MGTLELLGSLAAVVGGVFLVFGVLAGLVMLSLRREQAQREAAFLAQHQLPEDVQ